MWWILSNRIALDNIEPFSKIQLWNLIFQNHCSFMLKHQKLKEVDKPHINRYWPIISKHECMVQWDGLTTCFMNETIKKREQLSYTLLHRHLTLCSQSSGLSLTILMNKTCNNLLIHNCCLVLVSLCHTQQHQSSFKKAGLKLNKTVIRFLRGYWLCSWNKKINLLWPYTKIFFSFG